MTAQNAPVIEELCRRLEGVPLAIELAASRAAVLSPEEMLERLGERFRLLQTRAPDLPPRQRALRGAIDWSYDLLNDDDKELLAQLSVFVGGFTLPAAEDICDEFDVLEGVAELRRHSLLRTEESEGKTRFSMLEAVRAYACEKLRDSVDDSVAWRRHAEYFLRFFERLAARLNSREEVKALHDFFAERANGQAALDWLVENGEKLSAARLALALSEFLSRGGFWGEARRVVEAGLSALSSLPDAGDLRPRLQFELASLAHDMGDASARTLAEQAMADFRTFGFTSGEAGAMNLLGLLAVDEGDFEKARALFENSLQLRGADEYHGRAIALHNLALLSSRLGNIEEAQQFYESALAERRAGGDLRGEAETLGNLGALSFKTGDINGARQLYQQSLEIRRTLRDRFGIALMLFNLAEVAENQSDWPRTIALYIHAGRLFHELGSPFESASAEVLARLESQLPDYLALRPIAENAAWEEWV